MKKFKKLISVVLAALMVLALSSCDLIQDAEIIPVIPNGVEASDIRIGILFSDDYEKEDTAAYIQNEALNTMRGTYGIAGTIPKNKLPLDNKQKVEDAIISCVKESGCNVVLSTEPAFTEIVYSFANNADYQNIVFVCLDNSKAFEATANFHCFYPNYSESYCLAGIAAASKGEANIKFTADDDSTLEAFTLGAKAAAPASKIINGAKIDTYGTIVTNWHIYYITLIENITLGKFSEMGDYYAGVGTGFCDFVPAEEYATAEINAKLADAKANFCDGKWDIAKADTIVF